MVQRQITIAASFELGTIITREGQRFRAVGSSREGGTIFTAVREVTPARPGVPATFERPEVLAETRAVAARRASTVRVSRAFRPPQIQTIRAETPDITQVKTLFSPTLSPKVTSILSFEAAGGGLEGARLQRFENLKASLANEKAKLDALNKTLEREQKVLSRAVDEFNKDQERLKRLARNNLLQEGVAIKNTNKGKKLNEQVESLNKRVDKANASADTFNKGIQAINRTEQRANVKVGKTIKEIKSQPIARFEAAPTKKEVREELVFPPERILPTEAEFEERRAATALGFEELLGGVPGIGFAQQLGLVTPVARFIGGAAEFFETGLRGVGAVAETGIGVVEQVTGDPFSFRVTLPRETAQLISGLRDVPIIGAPFVGVGVQPVSPTATELFFGKPQVARAAVAAAELELLLGFPVTSAALRGIGVVSRVGKVPKVVKKVKAPKTPSALQKAIAAERKRLIVETDIFGLPQRPGVVPAIAERVSAAETRFIDTISLAPARALTKAQLARLRLEQQALETIGVPIEAARVGAARRFERAFLTATGAGERAEFGLGRAVEGFAGRAASAEVQARLLGLRGQAALIRVGRGLRTAAQRAAFARQAARARTLTEADLLFGRAAKPVARAQFEASLLGLGVESKAIRLARIARQRAQVADIVGTTALERGLEVVTPTARVAARARFETKLIRLRAAARGARGKAKVRLLKQVAKIEVKEAARRTRLVAREAELGFERFVDPLTRPLARAAITPRLLSFRVTVPVSKAAARAQQEAQLLGIVGKTAAKRIAKEGVAAIAPSIARAQLAVRAPVRRLQFELGAFRPFEDIQIPVLEGVRPVRPRVLRRVVRRRRTAQEDIDEFIGVGEIGAPTPTGFAPAQTFEELQLQLGQVARGRRGRQRQVLLLEEEALPRAVPRAARVPKEFVSPFDVTSIISKSLLGLRTGTAFATKDITGITSINATALKDFEILTAKQFQEIGSGIRAGLRSQARTAEQTFTEQFGLEAVRPVSAVRTRAATRLRRAVIPRLGLAPRVTIIPRPPPPFVPLLLGLPTFETLLGTRERPRRGFSVSVKTKGRFQKINRKPLTRSSALGLGASFVDRGVEKSFFITRSKKKGKPKSILGIEGTFNPFKFRRPVRRSKLPRETFIERDAFAIDTPGERQGITFKGLLALERRRAVRKILRLPTRRRKRKTKKKRKR